MAIRETVCVIVSFLFVLISLSLCVVRGEMLVYRGVIQEDAVESDDVILDKPLYVRNRNGLAKGEICGYTMYKTKPDLPFRTVLLEPMTGSAKIAISSGGHLDFEKQREYVFEIAAHDCVNGAHAAREKVIIEVEDINDHAPEWKTKSYAVDVEEKRIYGKMVHLEAIDKDGSEAFSKICYYRVATPNVPFKVDESGYMMNTEPLDYTRRDNYVVEVVAEDCAGLTSASILVYIKVTPMCRPHWTDIPDSVEFSSTSGGQKKILPNARLDLCGLNSSCNLTRLMTTVKLTISKGDTDCDKDVESVRAQRKLCGTSADVVHILPETISPSSAEEALPAGVYSFDGKTMAIDVSTSKLGARFGKRFTLSSWIKHGDSLEEFGAGGDKEQILCLADGEAMNRQHVSLSLHNCRLVLLLRQEADDEEDLSKFKPSEWRWKLEKTCDSTWHHYAISVEYPEVRLYVDGQQFVDEEDNPEIIDDWPLHPTKNVRSSRLVVGACWQGRNHRLGQFFQGHIAGLTVLRDATESDQVLHCINSCSEKLDFTTLDDMQVGTSVSMNSAKTTVVINGATREATETLLQRITYINAKISPTIGPRLVSLETLAICSEGVQLTLEMGTTSIKVKEPAKAVVSINATTIVVMTEEDNLYRGQKLFSDLTLRLTSKQDDDEEEQEQLERYTLDSCLVQVNSHMNLQVEHLKYPENLVHDLGLTVDVTEDGLVISGTDKLSSYEDILHGVKYVNSEPKNFKRRSFTVSCTEENGRYIGNKVEISLEMVLVQPANLPAAMVDNKMSEPELNKLIIEKLPNYDSKSLNSKQIGVGMAIAILACVSLMVGLAVAGAVRMRGLKEQGRGEVNIDEKLEMEWDNSALTITVNPMEQEMLYEDQSEYVGGQRRRSSAGAEEADTDDEPSVHDGEAEASEGEGDGEASGGGEKVKRRELEWDDSTLTY